MTTDRQAVAAAVLAGGAGRRFGGDKTSAPLEGTTLLGRVASALTAAGLAPVVAIGGPDPRPDGVTAIADRHPGEGPLGGVLTALEWSPRAHTVVVAADLPLLDATTVRSLVHRAGARPGSVAVARAAGHLQPTCACWPRTALAPLRSSFDAGERSIARALAGLAVEPVDVPARVVADVDTPDDLARLIGAVGSR